MLALTVGRSRDAADPDRPQPKRPEVLVTTALTGEGVPELLAALERQRTRARESDAVAARLARAEAQVRAIVLDRVGRRSGPRAG